MSEAGEQSGADRTREPLGLLPPPPYRLQPDYLARHRRMFWWFMVGTVFLLCCVLVTWDSSDGRHRYEGLVVCVMLLWFAWHHLRMVQLGKAVAANGVEILCEVLDVVPQKTRLGTMLADVYRVGLAATLSDRPKTADVRIHTGTGTPLYVRPGFVLALYSPSTRRPLLLRQNLWPLQLSDDEIRSIAARLQRVCPDDGWRVSESSKGLRLINGSDIADRAEAGRAARRRSQGLS